jgi:hypothetical protein
LGAGYGHGAHIIAGLKVGVGSHLADEEGQHVELLLHPGEAGGALDQHHGGGVVQVQDQALLAAPAGSALVDLHARLVEVGPYWRAPRDGHCGHQGMHEAPVRPLGDQVARFVFSSITLVENKSPVR